MPPKRQTPEVRKILSEKQRGSWASGDRNHQRTGKTKHPHLCSGCGVEFFKITRPIDGRKYYCNHQCAMRKRMKSDRPSGLSRKESDRWRYRNEPQFRIRCLLKRGLQRMLKNQKRTGRMDDLVGCSYPQLVAHIESQFKTGMNWENMGHGKGKWQIDHITPIAAFDFRIPDQMRQCWNWQNLRPLWAIENNKKRDSLGHGNGQVHLPLCQT